MNNYYVCYNLINYNKINIEQSININEHYNIYYEYPTKKQILLVETKNVYLTLDLNHNSLIIDDKNVFFNKCSMYLINELNSKFNYNISEFSNNIIFKNDYSIIEFNNRTIRNKLNLNQLNTNTYGVLYVCPHIYKNKLYFKLLKAIIK